MSDRTLLCLRSLGWLLLVVGVVRFLFALDDGTSGWVLVVSLVLIETGSFLARLRYVVRGHAGEASEGPPGWQ